MGIVCMWVNYPQYNHHTQNVVIRVPIYEEYKTIDAKL